MNIKKIKLPLFAVAFLCLSAWANADTYTYDSLNRLTEVTYDNGDSQTYSYDAAGNLLSMDSTGVNTGTDIAIGKTYQGGIIFYVDSTGEHGLIAAPTDQSTGIQWYNGSNSTTGATGIAVGTGQANTNMIIAVQGAGSYAAKLCADLVIGAYSDWYLPSRDELTLMYQNIGDGAEVPLTNVGGFADTYVGGFDNTYYWSSTEYDGSGAWFKGFYNGTDGAHFKNNSRRVRAIRAF